MVIQAMSVPDPDFIPPKILFKETITQKVTGAVGKFIAQADGRDQYAHVVIDAEPTEPGKGVIFINNIKGGAIPQEFINSVEEGIRIQALTGILAGYPVTDIQVTLVDGSSHAEDSNKMAFQSAARNALREALTKGKPVLLEPIMKLEIVAPEDYWGAVVGDLVARRAMIHESGNRGKLKTTVVEVPLMEMVGYAGILHAVSKGTASVSIEPHHYAQVPSEIAHKIIKGR